MRKFALSLVVLSLVAIPAFAGKYNKVISVGDKAPDFSGIPAIENGEEKSLTPVRHQGRRRRCRLPGESLPRRQGVRRSRDRLYQGLQRQGRQGRRHRRVAAGTGDKLPGIKDYMKENKSNYIYGYDESQAIGKAYGATNTPQFFVLDKERKIRYTGAMDDSQREDKVTKTYLRDAVDALLKGESVAVEETRPQGCGVQYKK